VCTGEFIAIKCVVRTFKEALSSSSSYSLMARGPIGKRDQTGQGVKKRI